MEIAQPSFLIKISFAPNLALTVATQWDRSKEEHLWLTAIPRTVVALDGAPAALAAGMIEYLEVEFATRERWERNSKPPRLG